MNVETINFYFMHPFNTSQKVLVIKIIILVKKILIKTISATFPVNAMNTKYIVYVKYALDVQMPLLPLIATLSIFKEN